MVHYDIVAYLRVLFAHINFAGVLTLGVGVYQALRAPAKKLISLAIRKGKSTTS